MGVAGAGAVAAEAAGMPCAIYMGLDSGHGMCIPPTVHATVPCGTPCQAVPKKSIAAMDPTNIWPPFAQTPLNVIQTVFNVVVNNNIPIVDQDNLINHPSPCTQLIVFSCSEPPKPAPCPTSTLCAEDVAGGGAHVRKATATTKSVFMNKKRVCRVSDPLGPPCLSLIATGAVNVLIGA